MPAVYYARKMKKGWTQEMVQETFKYSYSAKEAKEIREIRSRYLPAEENKVEVLRRLDRKAREAGKLSALVIGVVGCLIFGVGMCFGLKVLGDSMAVAVVLGLLGAGVMGCAYPVFRSRSRKAKEQLTPRILALADELSNN